MSKESPEHRIFRAPDTGGDGGGRAPGGDLLEKLNKAIAEDIGKPGLKWKQPLETMESYGKLKGERVVMVDDADMVLTNYAPELMAAAEGEASFIRYRDEDLEPLVEEIMRRDFTLVLLDYSMPPEAAEDDWDIPDKLNGADVARELRRREFHGKIIGFSSEKSAVGKFMEAGADGAVEKDTFELARVIDRIAEAIKT